MEEGNRYCPQCGSAENGFFCRNCGALVGDEDNVLCPRCHHVVPAGEYCNQCGQALAGIAVHLRQLALAGDTFWVTPGPPPAEPAPSLPEESLYPADESVELSQANLPDWLKELKPQPVPQWVGESKVGPIPERRAEPRVYPSLTPIEPEGTSPRRRGFLAVIIILLIVLLVGIVGMALFTLLQMGF